VGLVNLAGCPTSIVNELQDKLVKAFDPLPDHLDWQIEPGQTVSSAEEARAWANTQDLDLLIWGHCPEANHIELAAELVNVPHAPEMAELAQVTAGTSESRLFYLGDLVVGLVAYALGDYDRAEKQWGALLELVVDLEKVEPGWTPRESVQLLLLLGNSRVYVGEYSAAISYYEQTLKTEAPIDLRVAAGNNLGVARFDQQMKMSLEAKQPPALATSLQAYSTTLELDPGFLISYLNRAQAYTKLYEWDAALRDCERALTLSNQQSAAAYYCRGIVHLNRLGGSEAEFRADMDTALRINEGGYAPPYYMLASYHEMRGARDLAQDNYQAYLERLEPRPYLLQDRRRIEWAIASLSR
jgi:tetratricopeptide (TPR) repeat protein